MAPSICCVGQGWGFAQAVVPFTYVQQVLSMDGARGVLGLAGDYGQKAASICWRDARM